MDKNFRYDLIKNKNFYIVPSINNTSYPSLSNCNNLFIKNFNQFRPYYNIVEPEKTIELLKQNESIYTIYNNCILQFKEEKIVENKDFFEIKKQLQNGFIIFYKFIEYQTKSDSYTEVDFGDKGPPMTTRSITSTLTGIFTIFYLENGENVFDVKHTATMVSKSQTSFLADMLVGDSLVTQFSPEQLADLFFKEIIQNFPKK